MLHMYLQCTVRNRPAERINIALSWMDAADTTTTARALQTYNIRHTRDSLAADSQTGRLNGRVSEKRHSATLNYSHMRAMAAVVSLAQGTGELSDMPPAVGSARHNQ